MCISPRLLNDGILVSCRVCWQCKADRVRDWNGRCIAEAKSAAHVVRAQLTYGRNPAILSEDHPHAAILHYPDVQLWLKRLRKHTSGGLRFFCCGEFGERKGRSHWHCLLFFQKELPPNIQFMKERFLHGYQDEPEGTWQSGKLFWEHGFSFFENFTGNQSGELVAGIRYVTKYVTKDQGEGGLKTCGMSVKPPLGDGFFRTLAGEYVLAGLSPQDFAYRFAGVLDAKGNPLEFWIRGSSQYNFLVSFYRQWVASYGNTDWPQSEIMDDFLDEFERRSRRALGIPDLTDEEVDDVILDESLEKEGIWPAVSTGVHAVKKIERLVQRDILRLRNQRWYDE